MTDSTNGGVVKVTVVLPLDTVSKLDAMAKSSLLASRGRVIQALVDEVIEVRATVKDAQLKVKSMNANNQGEVVGALLSMGVALNDVSRRLSKFEEKPS